MKAVPSDLVSAPELFGASGRMLAPAPGVGPTDPRYRAAMLQHVLARSAREALRLKRTNVEKYFTPERGPGLYPDRQRRILRGATAATGADIMFWCAEFPTVRRDVITYLEHASQPSEAAAKPQ